MSVAVSSVSPRPADDLGWLDLFDWQREALDAWHAAEERGVVQAVTCAGKTRVGIAAIAQARATDRRCVVIVPTLALVSQWTRQMRSTFPDEQVANDPRVPGWNILVCTVHKASKQPVFGPDEYGLLVADECHRYGALTFAEALRDEFDWRLGLSATFERGDSADADVLDPYFNSPDVLPDQSRSELQDAWWVSDDRDALEYARRQGITTRETIDVVAMSVADGDLSGQEGFQLMSSMADHGRALRLPATPADLTR